MQPHDPFQEPVPVSRPAPVCQYSATVLRSSRLQRHPGPPGSRVTDRRQPSRRVPPARVVPAGTTEAAHRADHRVRGSHRGRGGPHAGAGAHPRRQQGQRRRRSSDDAGQPTGSGDQRSVCHQLRSRHQRSSGHQRAVPVPVAGALSSRATADRAAALISQGKANVAGVYVCAAERAPFITENTAAAGVTVVVTVTNLTENGATAQAAVHVKAQNVNDRASTGGRQFRHPGPERRRRLVMCATARWARTTRAFRTRHRPRLPWPAQPR